MKHFTIYDSAGTILRLISVTPKRADETIAANLKTGEQAIEGHHDPEKHRIVDGVPVVDADLMAASAIVREARAAASSVRAIEQASGPRAVREALLKLLPEGPERDRIAQAENAVAALRPALTKVVPAVVDDAESGVIADGEVLKGTP